MVQRVVAEVAAEQKLPLAADKEESMVLRGGCGRKKKMRNGLAEKVKWLWVILDISNNNLAPQCTRCALGASEIATPTFHVASMPST